MACSECNSREIPISLMCACNGLLICKSCVHAHFGPQHYVYNRKMALTQISAASKLEVIQRTASEINSVLQRLKQLVAARSEKESWTLSNRIKGTNWKFVFNSEKILKCIHDSISYAPPPFEDYTELEKYIPVVRGNLLIMMHTHTLELGVLPLELNNLFFYTIVCYKNCIYIVGGCNGLGQGSNKIRNITKDTEFYMTSKRYFHSSVIYNNYIIIVGGFGDKNTQNTIEIINLEDTSERMSIELKHTMKLPVAFVIDDRITISYITKEIQWKLTIDIINLFPESLIQEAIEDISYGTIIIPRRSETESHHFQLEKYSWTNTAYKVHNNMCYFVRSDDNKLIEYDCNQQTSKEINIDFIRS